ncbi:hypothetical protein [Sorangium sp. So ce131]|uniref:hypothetical protein n=1 Tax=Sorangium sp. So ce131 TaxID=3133282 RepID=UPI003F643938
MQLRIEGDRLALTLQGVERILALKLAPIVVPREHVVRAEAALPPATWKQLRWPGTSVPGLIKAGTYYTDRGKEFWYTGRVRSDNRLTIELEGEPYRRLVVTVDDAVGWAERINTWVKG